MSTLGFKPPVNAAKVEETKKVEPQKVAAAPKDKPKGFLKSAFNFMTGGILGGEAPKPKEDPTSTKPKHQPVPLPNATEKPSPRSDSKNDIIEIKMTDVVQADEPKQDVTKSAFAGLFDPQPHDPPKENLNNSLQNFGNYYMD
jgi:hypothetical protein